MPMTETRTSHWRAVAGSATPTAPKRCNCSDAEINATLAGLATPTRDEDDDE